MGTVIKSGGGSKGIWTLASELEFIKSLKPEQRRGYARGFWMRHHGFDKHEPLKDREVEAIWDALVRKV